jgi:Protein of unknown function (DUF2971)
MEVKIGESISESDVLWRYMSIDKFICLLEGVLYFPSLSSFKDSDPFEGYIPVSALRALMGYSRYTQKPQWIDQSIDVEKEYQDRISGIYINCWHANHFESEAMWRLYSKQNDGIAIRTTVGRLKNVLEEFNQGIVHVGRVKYIDFDNQELNPNECMSDNVLFPLIKRRSYEHEKEIRIYLDSWENGKKIFADTVKSRILEINSLEIFDAIYISPYARHSFVDAIYAVCKKYGIERNRVEYSNILSNPSRLFACPETSVYQ